MKLISCESCGVVLDTDKIDKPEMYNERGLLLKDNAQWNSWRNEFEPVVECPCCKIKIAYFTGEM